MSLCDYSNGTTGESELLAVINNTGITRECEICHARIRVGETATTNGRRYAHILCFYAAFQELIETVDDKEAH
jgi:hypothetical protein